MTSKSTKLRLPVLTTLMLLGIFTFGAATGAFMYATGTNVIGEVYLKMVSHTEYRYGESGQVVARLVDFQGAPVTVTSCNATILYPDKSYFANMAAMTASGNISGDHYYSFTTPQGPEGVYEYQATCFYLQGATPRNQSVTNSFHLSGAFNSIMDNQTAHTAQLVAIQGNLTVLNSELLAINTSLSTQIENVNASLSSDINGVLTEIQAVNTTITSQLTALEGQLNSNTTTILSSIDSNTQNVLNQLNSNTTTILAAIANVTNPPVNLTPVLDAIAALDVAMDGNFTYTNGLITTLQTNMNNNFTVAFNNQEAINTTANNVYSLLQTVNTTTTNTYQYLTGTMATNVNNILGQLGVINATVNRIETNTVEINSTVTDILTNQENQVYMSVFSG